MDKFPNPFGRRKLFAYNSAASSNELTRVKPASLECGFLWKYEEKHLVKKLPLQNNELQQKSQEEKTHAADNGIKQDVAAAS